MKTTKQKYRRVAEQVYNQPWLLVPERLALIAEVLELRRTGQRFTEAELRERLGADVLLFDDEEDDGPGYRIEAGVAILPLDGVMSHRMNLFSRISGGTSTELFGQWLDQVLDNPSVRAVLIDCNSPGGSSAGVDELATKIHAARGTKPIVAVANVLMASAAYYVCSAADQVVVSPSATVGAIGTYTIHREYSQASLLQGVRYTVLSAGRHKTDGNPYEPLSAQAHGTILEYVQSIQEMFLAAVARNRGVTPQQVVERFGDGKCFFGARAVTAGLADRVATFDAVLAELQATARESGGPPPSPVSRVPLNNGVRAMNPALKAALAARKLIDGQASDEIATAAVTAFFAGRGQPLPADEAAMLAALEAPAATAAVTTAREQAAAEPSKTAAVAMVKAQVDAIRAAENARVREITQLCETARLPALVAGFIENISLSVDDVRARLFDAMQKQNGGVGESGGADPLTSDPDQKFKTEYRQHADVHGRFGVTEEQYVRSQKITAGLLPLQPASMTAS